VREAVAVAHGSGVREAEPWCRRGEGGGAREGGAAAWGRRCERGGDTAWEMMA
jgi:hypothetical protein